MSARFDEWYENVAMTRGRADERYLRNAARLAWLAAKADDAEICDRLCVSIVGGSFPALASAHASVVVATCAETIRDSAKDGPS